MNTSRDASIVTKRSQARTIFANLVIQRQLVDEGKLGFIQYQGGGSTSDVVTIGATFGALVTTPAQRDAILASVNGILPATPVFLTATPGNELVFLTWVSVPNRGLPISGYTITIVTNGTSRMIPVGSLSGYVIHGLTNGTSYTFSVYATNPAGNSAPSASVTATPSNIDSPLLLFATGGDGEVSLIWLASISLDITGYSVVYSPVTEPSTQTTIPVGNVLTYTVTGLTNGTLYTFYVYATSPVGNGPSSTSLTATPSSLQVGLKTIYGGGTLKIPVGGYYDGNGILVQFNNPNDLIYDSSGSLYVADQYNNIIRKIDLSGNVSTFAGNGSDEFADGQGTNAAFAFPRGLTFDSSGNLYIADTNNSRIRKIDSSGNVSTFAGNGSFTYADGQGTNAAFNQPARLAFDSGNLYISDTVNNRIRKIDSSGNVSTFAGRGAYWYTDGQGTNAAFAYPQGLTFDSSGNLYVSDTHNNLIRKIDVSGNVSTFAGNDSEGSADGEGTNATFNSPQGITFDSGNLYVADIYNNRIRKIDMSGNVSTFAGSSDGYADGQGTNTAFDEPQGLTFDSSGNMYIADANNDIIRKIDMSGNVTTLPGGACIVPNEPGDGIGVGTNVLFDRPTGILKTPNGLFIADGNNDSIKKIDSSGVVTRFVDSGLDLTDTYVVGMAFDSSDAIYIADTYNNVIKKVDTSGNVTIFAGDENSGYEDGQGTNARFDKPCGITFDMSGSIYVADQYNYVIRKIDSSGNVSTFAGDGSYGSADGEGTNASFAYPCGITVDSSGNLYVADYSASLIRKINIDTQMVTTFAGNGTEDYIDAQGTNAAFDEPYGIAFYSGSLYVADTDNNLIRKIDMSGNVTTFLGGGPAGNNRGSVDGVGTNAMLYEPTALTVDAGVLYICDNQNNTIRSVNLNSNSDPRPTPPTGLSAVAGNGQVTLTWLASTGDVSGYTIVYIVNRSPITVAVGNVLTYTVTGLTNTSSYTFYVYATSPLGNSGPSAPVTATPSLQVGLKTIYGGGVQQFGFDNGNYIDGYAFAAMFSDPEGIAVDSSGNLYVADSGNNRIRKIDLYGNVSTFAGNSSSGYADGQGTNASFETPDGLTFDSSGNLYIADYRNNRIRKIDSSGNVSTFAGSSRGSADGQGTNAAFNNPIAIRFGSGNLYVSDESNNRIRKIDMSGNVSTFAGSLEGYAEGQGTNAAFDYPQGLTFDSSGNLYVADEHNSRIRKIDPSGNVSTFAGSLEGYADGQGTNAAFDYPEGLTFDSSGNLYVADTNNHRIRKIDPSGNVSTFAGNSSSTYIDAKGTNARFDYPSDIVFYVGNLYIVEESSRNIVRKLNIATQDVTTVAGGACTVPKQSGNEVGVGTNVLFDRPTGILKTPNGLFIADGNNNSIKKIDSSGVVTRFVDSDLSLTSTYVVGMAFDSSDAIYIADTYNNVIKKVDTSGNVSTFAGDGSQGSADGEGTNATFDEPCGITFDFSGNLYVADKDSNVIRKIDSSGNVSTFAGDGSSDSADGEGTNASFEYPQGLTVDSSGNLYVADYSASLIRKINIDTQMVTTFAGNHTPDYIDAQGTNAAFDGPRDIAFYSGNLYVADTHNDLIRKIDMSGNVTTFLGGGGKNFPGCVDGVGTFAMLYEPRALTIDAGVLYICDSENNTIRSINLF